MARETRPLSAIEWFILHHTASADKYSTHETLDAHLKATRLGYHGTIDDDAVFSLKSAGDDGKFTYKSHAPLTEVLWGAAGCNYHGAHLAIDGNSLTTGVTEDEKDAVVQVFATWAKQLGWKKADVLGTKTRPSRIQGHRYVGTNISAKKYGTACPGDPLIDWLPECRRRVADYLPA